MKASMTIPEFISYAATKGIFLEGIEGNEVIFDSRKIFGMVEKVFVVSRVYFPIGKDDNANMKIPYIKLIRSLTGLSLAESKLASETPNFEFACSDEEEASKIVRVLSSIGIHSEIKKLTGI